MRALLVLALAALGGCASGFAESCAADADCEQGLICVATRSPPASGETGKVAVDVKYCLKPCAKDTECASVSDAATCQATVAGRTFCAESAQ